MGQILCLGKVTTISNVSAAIVEVASITYDLHKKFPGQRFTVEEQKAAYSLLLEKMSKYYWGGTLHNYLVGENSQEVREFIKEAFRAIDNPCVFLQKEIDPYNTEKSKDNYNFKNGVDINPNTTPATNKTINDEVFDEFLIKYKVNTSNATPVIDNTLTADESISVNNKETVTTEVESLSTLIKKLFNETNWQHNDPTINFLRHTVSTSHVDGRVAENGTAQGYTGIKNVAIKVKSQLDNRIYNYFDRRADHSFSTLDGNKETKYFVFTPDRKPEGVTITETKGDIKIGTNSDFTSVMLENGKVVPVKFILANNLEEVKIALFTTLSAQKTNTNRILDEFTKNAISDPSKLSPENLPVYYSYILTNKNNFDTFLKYMYPVLGDAYKNRAKRSFSEPGTTFGSDQDTAATKLHKESTPRLVISDDGKTITINEETPYLTQESFNSVSHLLPDLESDLPSIRRSILELTKDKTRLSNNQRSILQSIYYRFFHEGDYTIENFPDIVTGNRIAQKFRSYSGILSSQEYSSIPISLYEKSKNKSELGRTLNAKLRDSLSAMITSIRSIQNQNIAQEVNGRQKRSNTSGTGVDIDSFNTDFVGRTTKTSQTSITTKSALINENKIKFTWEATSKKLTITIKLPKKPDLIYEATVNTTGGATRESITKGGIPLTITDVKGSVSNNELAEIFQREFKFPYSITSQSTMPTMLKALQDVATINANNYGIINTASSGPKDLTLDNLYINLLFTMALNGSKDAGNTTNTRSALGMKESEGLLTYNPIEVIYGYKKALSNIILAYGSKASKYITGFDNERLASESLTSSIKSLKKKIKQVGVNSIMYGNTLTGNDPDYTITDNNAFMKYGFKLGNSHKTVLNMSEKEDAMILMEDHFLQTVASSKDYSMCLIQIGTQADRLHPQMLEFLSRKSNGIFLRFEDLDMDIWNSARPKLAAFIDDSKLSKVTTFQSLQELLKNNEISYATIRDNVPELIQHGRVVENLAGRAMLLDIKYTGNLDTHKLSQKALAVHQNYYSNLDKALVTQWNDALSRYFNTPVVNTTLQQVSDYITENKVKYSEIKAMSTLLDSSAIERISVLENDKKVDYASVPESTLQSIAIFSNNVLGAMYMETMRAMYRSQLKNSGYTKISLRSIDLLHKVMGTSLTPGDAADVLFDAYFYNAQILGVSALNILTGGIAQYDAKKGKPLFKINSIFRNGTLNNDAIIIAAKQLLVPGSVHTLETISKEELLALREKAPNYLPLKKQADILNRLAYMKAILLNNKAFPDSNSKAIALLFNELTQHQDAKFVSQVKRNAVLGTGRQLPRIVGKNEPGAYLGTSVKSIVVEDDEVILRALGVSGGQSVVTTDGVQMILPLEEYRWNNSVGNDESTYKYDGVAMKTLTVSVDEYGQLLYQKKAEFGSMDDGLLIKGTSELEQLLKRAYTAITFDSKEMLVEGDGPSKWTKINSAYWKKHGLTYGMLKFDDGTNKYLIHSSTLLYNIKRDEGLRARIEQQLDDGVYSTDKVERSFDNVYDIWTFFGAHTNTKSVAMTMELIGNHSGNLTTELDLSDSIYPNRDAYIGKIGYLSQEKTGARNVLKWDNLIDNNFQFAGIDNNGNAFKYYSEVSNEDHGSILQAQHGYDTTAAGSAQESDSATEECDSQISLISQIISAVNGEGMSQIEAENISTTLRAITKAALEGWNRKIVSIIIDNNPKLKAKEANILRRLEDGLNTSESLYTEEITKALEVYYREFIAKTLNRQERDPGLSGELLAWNNLRDLTFDQKQLLPLFQSQLFADFNTKAVKIKLAGGQNVVSPSHMFLPTYSLKDEFGRSILDGMSREDMNNMFYGDSYKDLPKVSPYRLAIDRQFPLAKITDISKVKLSDIIVMPKGRHIKLIEVRKQLQTEYFRLKETNDPSTLIPFEQYFQNEILSKNYRFKLGGITPETGESLKWMQWQRHLTSTVDIQKNGGSTVQSVLDTDEFKAYDAIAPLAKAYREGKTFDKFYRLDLTLPLIGTPVRYKNPTTFKGKIPAVLGQTEQAINILQSIPDNLVKEYFFSKINEKTAGLPYTTALLSSEQLQAYATWKTATIPIEILRDVYEFVGKEELDNPGKLESIFKSYIYTLMQDDGLGWTSVPAEVYLPHMHAKTFLINTGEDGSKADSMFDFLGFNKIIPANKFESLGILTHQEALDFQYNYSNALSTFQGKDGTGRFYELTPAQQAIFEAEYKKPMDDTIAHITDEYINRVSKIYGTEITGTKSSDLFVFDSHALTDFETAIAYAITKRNKNATGSLQYNAMVELINKLRTKQGTGNTPENMIESIRQDFIKKKAAVLANNFSKTLDFIMARIPAQGKSYFTEGRIKNFIFSSKNSVYGPLELILFAGLDYDIDKQNMMTWAVNEDGNIIKWDKYFNDVGRLDTKILQTIIDANANQITKDYTEAISVLEEKLALAVEESDSDVISKLEKTIAKQKKYMTKSLANSEAGHRLNFTKAGQNFIVHNLIEVIGSPKNAIEASTVSSMSKVSDAIKVPDMEKMFTDDINIEDILIGQKVTSNVNPWSTIQYEKITMDGKSGIGINASDTKAYFAAYYATITATEEEQKHVVMKSDLKRIPVNIANRFGITNIPSDNALQFFRTKTPTITTPWSLKSEYKEGDVIKEGKYVYTALKDVPIGVKIDNVDHWIIQPEIITIRRLANAERWSSVNSKKSEAASKAISRLRVAVKTGDATTQLDIISKYMDDVQWFSKVNVDNQAWEELSELLSASTDNAKELILGKIGVNSTTNSIVNTMIRMGVSLRYAVELINSDTILKITKKVLESTDLKTRHEVYINQENDGILKGEDYALRFLDILKAELPKSTPDINSKDSAVFEYLTDPARLLYTYVKISSEFSGISKKLSINQGLKNSASDVYSYIDGINIAINKTITDYNADNPNAKVKMDPFDLETFVTDVSNERTEKLNSLFDAMDEVRTGPNIPFVLYKNSHYLGYFEALFQAKAARNMLTYVYQYVDKIIDRSRGKDVQPRNIPDAVYKKIADSIHELGILNYLRGNSKTGPNREAITFTIDNVTYDLSKNKKVGEVMGRKEFLNDMPNILEAHAPQNEFTKFLYYDRPSIDTATNESITVLKGKNLDIITSEEYARVHSGLNQIKLSAPTVYNALFNYSIIVSRGGYAGGSFVGFFPGNKYLEFSRFLKDSAPEIMSTINTNQELMEVLNPLLLKQVSTIDKGHDSEEIYDEDADIPPEEDVPIDFTDTGGDFISKPNSLDSKKYFLDALNNSDLHKNGTRYIRSRDNGLTYKYNNRLNLWVPITKIAPNVAIPANYPISDSVITEDSAGIAEGFEINLITTNKLTGETDKGRVLTMLTSKMITSNEALSSMLAIYSEEDLKTTFYIVKNEQNKYFLMTKDALIRANPKHTFNENLIVPGETDEESIASDIIPRIDLYTDGTDYYSDSRRGKIHTSVERGKAITENYKVEYNDILLGALSKISDSQIDEEYTTTQVDVQFKNFENEIVAQGLATADLSRYKDLELARKALALPDSLNKSERDIINGMGAGFETLYMPAGIPLTILEKVNILKNGENELRAAVRYITGKTALNGKQGPVVKYPIEGKIPIAITSLVTKDAQDNINKMTLGDLKLLVELLKKDKSIFNKYMENYIGKNDVNMVMFNDGYVYYKKNDKIKSSKQLAVLNDKAEKGKPIYLPDNMRYEYSKVASKEVLFALTKFLNTRLPGVKWVMMSSAQIKKQYGKNYDESKAFFKSNGQVIINTDKATLETPFHEFGHVYLQYLAKENPGEYSRLMILSKEHDMFAVMKLSYPNLSDIDLSEEVFCELLSMTSAEKLITENNSKTQEILETLEDETGPFGKIKSAFKRLFRWAFNIKPKLNTEGYLVNIDLNMNDSLSTAINLLSADIVFGKGSILDKFTETTKDAINKSRAMSKITVQEGLEILKDRGYVEWFCVK